MTLSNIIPFIICIITIRTDIYVILITQRFQLRYIDLDLNKYHVYLVTDVTYHLIFTSFCRFC
jgi:hypothetical protein